MAMYILYISYNQNHLGFIKYYKLISLLYYIYGLTWYFCEYLKYYPKYKIYQIHQYYLYNYLQSVLISTILYYIITLNFIFALPEFQDFDIVMSVIYKYTKKVTIILDNVKWSILQ